VLVGLIFFLVGISAAALGITPVYRRVRAKRTGIKLSARVVSEDLRTDYRGFKRYVAKVRFQASDGNWVEHFCQYATGRSRVGQSVDVWYTPGDPVRVWVGGEPAFGPALYIVIGLLFSGASIATVAMGH
jgi:hypothetical protein